MPIVETGTILLLALPDSCLLAVLQCLAADDQRSLFSAARAHSRLHQAVLALRSITAVVTEQRQVDGVLLYLSKYRQHVDTVSINHTGGQEHCPCIPIRVLLEAATQQRSWQLRGILLSADAPQGVLVPTLTQLRLEDCGLRGDAAAGEALSAALSQLPSLEHLCIRGLTTEDFMEWWYWFPAGVLQQLQQLTYLELNDTPLEGPDDDSPALQRLQALTRLCDLRLKVISADTDRWVTASMFSGTQLLTRLDLHTMQVEPAVLAGKTRLQHLQMHSCMFEAAGNAALLAQLLSQLQQLQQLTHLDLRWTLQQTDQGPPAAAYAALTASSSLQHLNISDCRLPAGAWQHILPAGRQLPLLQELDISDTEGGGNVMTAPEGSRLVSCCPGLQFLDMRRVQYSAELLAALQGLSGLHTLRVGHHFKPAEEPCLEEVCQLTGLRELDMDWLVGVEGHLLLQMTQLKRLTALSYNDGETVSLSSQAPGDEPVWRQLLRRYLNDSDPAVAQQAAAGLAE